MPRRSEALLRPEKEIAEKRVRLRDGLWPSAADEIFQPDADFPKFLACGLNGRLKALSPHMGKGTIAQTLCQAGLHLAPTLQFFWPTPPQSCVFRGCGS